MVLTDWIIVAEDNRSGSGNTGNLDRYRFINTGPNFVVFDPTAGMNVPVPFPTCTPPDVTLTSVIGGHRHQGRDLRLDHDYTHRPCNEPPSGGSFVPHALSPTFS